MILRKRRGASIIIMIGVGAVILLFCLFFLELQTMFDYQYAIEVRAQRAINSTVEFAMDDRWRADGYNYMDVAVARNNLIKYLNEDLNVDSSGRCYDSSGNLLYRVTYGPPTYYDGKSGRDAGIEMDITVNMMASLGAAFGRDGYTWTNQFSSTNFRTDNDERAGRYEH